MKPPWGLRQIDQEGQALGLELSAEVPPTPVTQLESAQGAKLDHQCLTAVSKEALPGEVTDC